MEYRDSHEPDLENSAISPPLNHSLTKMELRPTETLLPDSGARRWFVDLVDAHGAAVLAVLHRLCRHAHDAEDVFQETAVRVWRFRESQQPVNVRAWLMTVAYRAFLDHRTRQERQSPRLPKCFVTSEDDVTDTRVHPPPIVAEQNETIERMNAAVSLLPDAVRDVVALHYSGGLSLSETALAMGLSPGTVKSRLSTALKQLRSHLE